MLARRGGDWVGAEIDLTDAEDLDGVVDIMRVAVGEDAETTLLLLEENDEWLAIVRVDDDSDPRVFVSDGRVVDTSTLGALLGEAAAVQDDLDEDDVDDDDVDDDADDDDNVRAAGDPIGDSDLVADLGTPSERLLKLCAEEGQLPADILSAVSERAGCLEALEQLRG
ncbi:MAG: tRNA adenosine deaminase-associated protein [Gaiellaceae bacterium]